MEISRIMSKGCHICHTRIEVAGTYGVAHDFVLLQDGLMVLAVFAQLVPVGAPSGFFDEVFRHVEVFPVARHLI